MHFYNKKHWQLVLAKKNKKWYNDVQIAYLTSHYQEIFLSNVYSYFPTLEYMQVGNVSIYWYNLH